MKKFAATCVAGLTAAAVAIAPAADAAKHTKKPIKLKITGGKIATTFTPEFVQALLAANVQVTAIAPGAITGADGEVTLTLPISGGTVKQKGKSATIKSKGGETLAKEGSTRTIENVVTKIKGKKTTVVADAGGTIPGVPGVTFLRGTGATFKVTKRSFTSTGKLALSDEAAADLTQFGITTFPAGTIIGTGKTTAKGKKV